MEHKNDNNLMITNIQTIKKLFPNHKNIDMANILIDLESIHYISIKDDAYFTTLIIKNILEKYALNNNIHIVDAMAGVGGNTISFAKNFYKVTSIEIDQQRYSYLHNNILIYKLNNVEIHNDNCLNILNKIYNMDAVFLDPPWGGKDYKKFIDLKIKIDDVPIENICNKLCYSNKIACNPKFIILKLPRNYDLNYFKFKIKNDFVVHKLKRMLIVIIINQNLITSLVK